MRKSPPLVVLVLGGVAERWGCPGDESPLARAETPHLDRLAEQGRVLGVRLLPDGTDPHSAAALIAILGQDPRTAETAGASYLGAGQTLLSEECFVTADFCSLFHDIVADIEPGPLRAKEGEVLLRAARDAVARAGFRLLGHTGPRHVAIAARASVDHAVAAPPQLLGRSIHEFEPKVAQHGFAHRLAREALDGHEVNEVRRDLGLNGADMVWMWGPGGTARLALDWEEASAFGTDPVWRAVCGVAGLPIRAPHARKPAQLVKALAQALRSDSVCFLYARRGVRDARTRDRRLRADGIADLDRHLVGPVVEVAAAAGARLLVLPDRAHATGTGCALLDPVPALLWGPGIEALAQRRFTEESAAAAGPPVEPGYGLLAYIRNL